MNRPATAPRLQALILADYVYVDRATNKHVIAGTFNELLAHELPTHFPRPTYAYISLTELRGPVKLELKYVDLSNLQVLMAATAVEIEVDDPFRTIELVVFVPTFPMPHEGVYSFELHSNGQSLGSQRITVRMRTEGTLEE